MDPPSAASLARDVDEAFPALVAALARPVYTVGLRLCGPDEAEDVTQETFVRAYKALGDYGPDRRRSLKVRPWVITIALNVARNRIRSDRDGSGKAKQVAIDGHSGETSAAHGGTGAPGGTTAAAGTAEPELAAENAELRTRLIAALRRLPLPAREAVVLRHIVGCSVAEVAEILDRPSGTVKAQVWRGLAALREDLAADRQIWEEQ